MYLIYVWSNINFTHYINQKICGPQPLQLNYMVNNWKKNILNSTNLMITKLVKKSFPNLALPLSSQNIN